MARIITIVNQKGGVGKTTTAVNLAAGLAVLEKKTLLIDFDPQGNATSGVGLDKDKLELQVYDALIGKVPLRDTILPTPTHNLWCVPGNIALPGALLCRFLRSPVGGKSAGRPPGRHSYPVDAGCRVPGVHC